MPAASPDQLIRQLPHGKLPAAIVLEGTDHYLREMCRNKIIEIVVPEAARDWAITRVSTRDTSWDEILGLAQMRPMLAERQVLIIDGAEHVEKLGEKSRDSVLAAIESYLTSPAPFTVLVIEATALDGRQKFSKMLHGHKNALVVSLTIGPESAALLAMQMAKYLKTEIDRDAAALLADIMNGEPARIRIELEKLSTYALGRRIVTADVEVLVVTARKNTIWQLAEMLAHRQRGPALASLSNLLREGEQPAALVGALAWRYRTLIERRDSQFSRKTLLAGLADLAEADSQFKSSNPNSRATMEFLIVRLTSPTP
jgi:DNA polymerase-3 subunit delta